MCKLSSGRLVTCAYFSRQNRVEILRHVLCICPVSSVLMLCRYLCGLKRVQRQDADMPRILRISVKSYACLYDSDKKCAH